MVLNLFNQTVTPSYFYKRFVPILNKNIPSDFTFHSPSEEFGRKTKRQPQLDLEVKPQSSRKDAARQ